MSCRCGSLGNETELRHLESSSAHRVAWKGEIAPLHSGRPDPRGLGHSPTVHLEEAIFMPVMCRWDVLALGSLANPQKCPHRTKESVFECLP